MTRMVHKGRDMKRKSSKKPTKMEIVQEVNYLGKLSFQNATVIKNAIGLLEKYIEFKGDTKEFTASLKAESNKQKSVKDILDKQSSPKSEAPKKEQVV